MSEPTRCANCGAPMKAGFDPRFHVCPYCGVEAQVKVDGGDLAKGLALDLNDIESFLTGLADALHGHLGPRTKLRKSGDQVDHFEINLDPDVFIAKREGYGLVAQHKKLVRGVALKTNTHPLDRWVELLSKALASHANENARVALILTQIKKG